MTTRKTLTARTPADLILAVRRAEGWTKIEGDGVATIRKMKALYTITADHRRNRYVATPKGGL